MGMRGADPQPESIPWSLPPGDKGTLVASWGKEPVVNDLYVEQVRWWRSASAAWRAGRLDSRVHARP